MIEAHVATGTSRNELARFPQHHMSADALVSLPAILVADRSIDRGNGKVRKVSVRVDIA